MRRRATTTRGRARAWTRTVTLALVVACASVASGTVRAQTCEAGCAPAREAREATRRNDALTRERDAMREAYDALERRATRERETAAEKLRQAVARAETAETAATAATAEADARRRDAAKTETLLERTMETLEGVKRSESERVRTLEARVRRAEEAWVPVWLQKRAAPAAARAKTAVEVGTRTTKRAVALGREQTKRAVTLGREQTKRAVAFGKERIPKVVQAVETRSKMVVAAGKERTAKVVDAANERIPRVVNAGKEHTAKLVNAGKDVVGGVSKTVGEIPKKMKVLKDLKHDFKEAKAIHEKQSRTGKPPREYPKKFSTRQAVRALELSNEAKSLWRLITSNVSVSGVFREIVTFIKDVFNRIFNAVKKSYRERFIPFTRTVRAATAKHVGIKLATLILSLPSDVLEKIPVDLSTYGVEKIAEKIADGIWIVVVSVVVVAILRDIFIEYPDGHAATYSFMKVPEENGVDVLIHLPRVESMDEVEFQFDQTFNQITIDAEDAGHSELIVVPKCKIGVKRWAKPSPVFLEDEEVVLVELRPIGVGRDRSSASETQPSRAPTAPFQPFAPVTKRAAPKKKASVEKAATTRASRSRR